MTNRRIPAVLISPSEYIQDYLDGRNWTQDDLAQVTGRSRCHINRLIGGKTAITPETAHELGLAFETSPELWMNLQSTYDLARSAKHAPDIQRRSQIYKRFPVRELTKRSWINAADSLDDLEASICRFMQISSIDCELPRTLVARKSTDYASDTPAQIAWFRRAEALAQAVGAARYDEGQYATCLERLKTFAANPADLRHIPGTLAEFGIRLVLVETIAKAKIDGVAFWLDDQSPAIALSLRYDRIDNFWHNLFHELSHIRHRHMPVIDAENCLGGTLPETEVIANTEAAHSLIDPERLQSFVLRNRPLFYQDKVIQFARSRGVHPGIVVGQLHGQGHLDYKHLRKLLAPIRTEIIGKALTDGWGTSIPI